MKRRGYLLLGLALLLTFAISLSEQYSEPLGIEQDRDTIVLSQHSAIEITSNGDFASQSWPGLGTPENPYKIDGLLIAEQINGACIRILNTDAHFEITNCIINPSNSLLGGIYFENVQNAVVDNCAIGAAAQGIRIFTSSIVNVTRANCDSSPISIDTSDYVLVYDCAIQNYPGDGISLMQSSFNMIEGNFITGSAANGIYAGEFSDSNYFLNNDVRYNSDIEIFIDSDCSDNYVYANNLLAGGACARDNGNNNHWDDGISLGNGYSDYGGSGTYTIPGAAGSVDHYPTIASTTSPTTSSSTSTSSTISTTTSTDLQDQTFTLDLIEPVPIEVRFAIAGAYVSASFMIAVIILFMIWRTRRQ